MVLIRGNITDALSGRPVENATVIIGSSWALTDENGDYIIYTTMLPGNYELKVSHRYYKRVEETVSINKDCVVDIPMTRE